MNIVHGAGRRLPSKCRIRLRERVTRTKFRYPKLVHWKDTVRSDWNEDLFFAYPDPSLVDNKPPSYEKLHAFYIGNKKEQWDILKEYFKCPEIGKAPYVVRPLRHEGGEGFEVVDTLPPPEKARTHYWRSLWERSCEYRVFFVRGHKVLTLLKRVPEGTPQNIPWNVGVSSFVTVHDDEHDRLRHSKFYEKAEAFFQALPFQFICVDVLYKQHKHRVVEINFSPNVSIDENIVRLAHACTQHKFPHANPGSI